MKVPEIFKPEKDLESETEKLLKKEVKMQEPKLVVEKSKLEETLKLFNTNLVHEKIEDLITKSGYVSIKTKGLRWDYWTKKTDYDENYVFTRWHDRQNTRYAFARVNDGKLEEFCERFEKDYRTKLFGLGRDRLPYLMVNAFGGSAFVGIATKYIALPYLWGGIDSALAVSSMAFLGAILGFLEGAVWLQYKHLTNRKKLGVCYTQLITDDKMAVRTAFS